MIILVTGATGFLGKYLLKELQKTDHIVYSLECDIRNIKQFPKLEFDCIFHLAALVTHTVDHTRNLLFQVNSQGTANLISKYPLAKFIFASTKDVYRKDLSQYAKSKKIAEGLVITNSKNLIIRIPSIFGPNQRQRNKLIPKLFRKYINNESCIIYNNDSREYIYVEDAATKLVKNIENSGIIDMNGFTISNHRLDTIVRSVCCQKYITFSSEEEITFITKLKSTFDQI